jgi:hypothetical protein
MGILIKQNNGVRTCYHETNRRKDKYIVRYLFIIHILDCSMEEAKDSTQKSNDELSQILKPFYGKIESTCGVAVYAVYWQCC